MQARTLAGYAGTYVVLAVAAVLTLGPFLFSVMTAFTSSGQFAQEGPLTIPAPPVLDNLIGLFTSADGFVTPVAVTVQMVAVILVGQMVFSRAGRLCLRPAPLPGP